MVTRRLLQAVNALLVLAAVAAAGAVYWYLWRPMPRTSGEMQAPVAGKTIIVRDARGVPHITAASVDDAMFAQGFVTAQDRMWQMDAVRRLAAGELAEVAGAAVLEADLTARRLRLRRIAEQDYRSMDIAERGLLAAYARGVNYYLEVHRDNLPPEFRAMGYEPRPWRATDTLLVGLQMNRTLSNLWESELDKQKLLAAGNAARVNLLFPVPTEKESGLGSNAWAVSGKWTASGKPILASDPHLEFSLPATWYQVHLKAPGLNVAGVSLPGVPCVIIGHNERIAWGVTNLHFDAQDLYSEKLDPRSGQYLFRSEVRQARQERDTILVKGERPREMAQWVTQHGPVMVSDGARQYALRWAAAESGPWTFPFLHLNQAKDWGEFRAALKHFAGPAQNFVYADTAGNIGYQAAGRLPARKSAGGDVPAEGWTGEAEWSGLIPFEDLPSVFNPPSGMIVSANQYPFPKEYPHRVSGNFSSLYRAKQIEDRLSAKKGWRPEEMLAVQMDVYSGFLHYLAGQAVVAVERRKAADAKLADAVALLKPWNGQVEKSLAAPLIAQLLYQHVRRSIGESAAPKVSADYPGEMAPAVVEKLLRERPAGWFDDWDKMLVEQLGDAVDEGVRMQGQQLSKWQYGSFNQLTLEHPVLRNVKWLGSYFNVGTKPMSGSSTTVKQTTRRLGPSMRFVADLSDWDRSLQNLTVGESGHLFSGHYMDQWPAYYAGTSFPLPFERVEAKSTLTLVPR